MADDVLADDGFNFASLTKAALVDYITDVAIPTIEAQAATVEELQAERDRLAQNLAAARDPNIDRLRPAMTEVVARWAQPPAEAIAKLPKPTKKDAQKGRCDTCGGWHGLPAVHLDYMGHADVTLALLDVDPRWTIEPLTDEFGLPIITAKDGRLVMWAHMTVLDVTRLCVGTCETGKSDPEKELIGDAIRNGAMRFGIGTRLWSKADGADPASAFNRRSDATEPDQPQPSEEDVTDARHTFERLRALANTPKADAMKAWAADLGRPLTVPEMVADPEWRNRVKAELDAVEAYEPETRGDAMLDEADAVERRQQLAEQHLHEAGLDHIPLPPEEP